MEKKCERYILVLNYGGEAGKSPASMQQAQYIADKIKGLDILMAEPFQTQGFDKEHHSLYQNDVLFFKLVDATDPNSI